MLLKIILIVLLVVIVNYVFIKKGNKQVVKLSKLESVVKTGDIILYSFEPKKTVSSIVQHVMQRAVFSMPWTHVGMVYKNESSGIVYVYEVTNNSPSKKFVFGTTKCYKLTDRLMDYNGHNAVVFLNKRLGSLQKNMLDEIINKNKFSFTNSLNSHLLFNCVSPFGKFNKKGVFCSEWITIVLQKIGVIKSNVNSKCIFPYHYSSFFNDYIMVDGYKYSKSYLIKVNA